jgi:NAD-dependent dihydropyrimidine dehydrogenase PreA subunit
MVSKIVKEAENQYKQGLTWRGKENPEYGVIINRETCIARLGCRNCIQFCPGDLIYYEDGRPEVKFLDECWYCGICAQVCGPRAISYIFPEQILNAADKQRKARIDKID